MSLTILHSTSGKHAAKRFTRDPATAAIKNRSFDEEKFFRVETVEIEDFAALCAVLTRLTGEAHAFVVRGEALPGINRGHCRRLLHRDPKSKDGPNFEVTPRRWLSVDIDHVDCPAAVDPVSDPEAAVEHLIGLLPPELHGAPCWWQFSSSQSLPGGADTLSAHLWFWTAEPYSDAELTRWALAHNRRVDCKIIDPALYRAVQPHYIAAPSFVGMEDPLPRRSGVRPGLDEEVVLVIPPPASSRRPEPGTAGYDPGLGVAAHLAEVGGANGSRGPILKAIASYIATHGSTADCGPLKAAIREALDRIPPDRRIEPQQSLYASDEHLDRMIEWVRQQHGDQPPRKAGGGVVETLNAQYAVVNEAGKVWVFEEWEDPQLRRNVIVRFSFADFQRLFMNRGVVTPAGEVSLGKFWLGNRDRRQYLGGVTFDPAEQAPAECWNLWRGFAVEPRQGDWRLMHDHICDVICAGVEEHRNYLLDTIARMVQQPQLPAEVAVVLRGKKGSGKGAVCVWLRRLWGQHGIHITNAKHLVGQFNEHLRDCVYLFADEAFFAGDKQHEGVLKALITEPTIAIEGKYLKVVLVPNLLHIWMAANDDWVIPASHDERRYFVLNVSDAVRGNQAHFEKLHREMRQGGLAAMLHDMLRRDITKFEHRVIPQTAALEEQKRLSLDTLDRWWLAVLERGFVWRSRWGMPEFLEWRPFVPTELLEGSYLQWCSTHRIGYPASRELLGKRMSEIYGASRPRGNHIIGEADAQAVVIWKSGRVTGYHPGNLDTAKAAFAAKRGIRPGRGGGGKMTFGGPNPDLAAF
jgi:hypothetical protein